MQTRLAKPALMSLALLLCAHPFGRSTHLFQARYLRPFDNQATLFDGSQLQLPAELAGPGQSAWCTSTWDPACPTQRRQPATP